MARRDDRLRRAAVLIPRRLLAAAAALVAAAAVLLPAAPASAHVVPSSVVGLAVHEGDVTASLTLPEADLAAAVGLEADGAVDADDAARIAAHLREHVRASSASGRWTTAVSDVRAGQTEQWGTGVFPTVTATAVLTPPAGTGTRSFTLEYDAVLETVVTADAVVVLRSDWAAGEPETARTLGTISVDTATGAVPPLRIDLADGSAWQGFAGMLALGASHIAEGTDHQLFLLTLLLAAPLVARGGRWLGAATTRGAIRRITAITIAFTIGHSVTLALGALGPPVPQQPVEALIAVSILIAAAHAVRPLFPGREALIAGLFGLVHGTAFSATLTGMDLAGGRLALSLLGFNLGIEAVQLLVVLLVLPPLVVLARTRAFPPLRVAAAVLTALAAAGWLLDRVGLPNAPAAVADSLGAATPWLVVALWVAAAAVLMRRRAATSPCFGIVQDRWMR